MLTGAEKQRRYRQKHKMLPAWLERQRLQKRASYHRMARNPAWRAQRNAKQKKRSAWRRAHESGFNAREAQAHKARAFRRWLVSVGWTEAENLKMFKKGCAICGAKKRKLMRDHNHATGKGRGLLCHKCNCCLGWFEKHRAGIETHLGEA